MKYERFEDLPVWKDAIELKLQIDSLCERLTVHRLSNLVDQIDAASLSISNNIAEGFEPGTTNELIHFLYIAHGSAGEVRSMLRYAERRPSLANLNSEVSDLIARSESISRQLRTWADHMNRFEKRAAPDVESDPGSADEIRPTCFV